MTQESGPASGTIVLRRTAKNDIGIRGLDVFLDGVHQANVSYGATIEFPVAAGDHTLKVSNSVYSKTDNFLIRSRETLTYEVANVSTRFGAIFAALGSGLYKVTLKKVA